MIKDKNFVIYQTVNGAKVTSKEKQAPIFSNDALSWLGEGYYFWDETVDTARWWGIEHCQSNYYIYRSTYDYYGKDYFDIHSNTYHREEFKKIALSLLDENNPDISVCEVLYIMFHMPRLMDGYKAVRARPEPIDKQIKSIKFDKANRYVFNFNVKTQICIKDLSFLKSKYTFVEKYPEIKIV